ncbi:MAG: hypothetical protein K2Q01_07705, partial [Rickettsiales bacterium]|nr:hypothetical protein [Rickettsiales bacterium]
RLTPECEKPMIDAVRQCPNSCVAHYGLTHVPALYHALKEEGKVELLTIDATNMKLSGIAQPVGSPDAMALKQRHRELEAMCKEAKMVRLVLNGKPPSYSQAHEMVMTAAFTHRQNTPGVPDRLDGPMAKQLLSMLCDISQESAPHEKPVFRSR